MPWVASTESRPCSKGRSDSRQNHAENRTAPAPNALRIRRPRPTPRINHETPSPRLHQSAVVAFLKLQQVLLDHLHLFGEFKQRPDQLRLRGGIGQLWNHRMNGSDMPGNLQSTFANVLNSSVSIHPPNLIIPGIEGQTGQFAGVREGLSRMGFAHKPNRRTLKPLFPGLHQGNCFK